MPLFRLSRGAGRRTNLALLVVLPASMATGALAFALGSGWGRWAVAAHGSAALALLLLSPWKSVIARRGLRRRSVAHGSGASLAFAALVAVALAAGIGHATGLLRTLGGGVTAMQVHVGAALASVPFAVLHVAGRRARPAEPIFPGGPCFAPARWRRGPWLHTVDSPGWSGLRAFRAGPPATPVPIKRVRTTRPRCRSPNG